jgi:UDP-N-acetylmuramate dehydrogenase
MKQMAKPGAAAELSGQLGSIAGLELRVNEPLAAHTRFGIGGPADLLVIATTADAFIEALQVTRRSGLPWVVIGGGTNLVVADAGFRGAVLKLAVTQIQPAGASGVAFSSIAVDAGVALQDLVDWSTGRGLKGLETMTGIPGWVGAAIYGNAGAYGHSISERVHSVAFFDGDEKRTFDHAACEFHYRESVFKRHKHWIILSAMLELEPADADELRRTADEILRIRNEKYPPTMKCAGSIFKNFLWAELPAAVQAMVPEKVVREGKVPSAWFLEQVGAKGLRVGDIQVAAYHANLIYNDGAGTARDLVTVIRELQLRVGERFRIPLEEEVQYVGEFQH